MQVVSSEFSFDRLDVPGAANAFCSVVEFNSKVEGPPVGGQPPESTVRPDGHPAGMKPHRILSGELTQRNAVGMSRHKRVDDEFGQRMCVEVVTGRQRLKVTAAREGIVRVVQEAVTVTGEPEILR